jgi:heme-degrading monooxygenase HmoA
MVLFTWESEDAFQSFRADPAVRENMVAGGMLQPPRFTVLNKIGEFPN